MPIRIKNPQTNNFRDTLNKQKEIEHFLASPRTATTQAALKMLELEKLELEKKMAEVKKAEVAIAQAPEAKAKEPKIIYRPKTKGVAPAEALPADAAVARRAPAPDTPRQSVPSRQPSAMPPRGRGTIQLITPSYGNRSRSFSESHRKFNPGLGYQTGTPRQSGTSRQPSPMPSRGGGITQLTTPRQSVPSRQPSPMPPRGRGIIQRITPSHGSRSRSFSASHRKFNLGLGYQTGTPPQRPLAAWEIAPLQMHNSSSLPHPSLSTPQYTHAFWYPPETFGYPPENQIPSIGGDPVPTSQSFSKSKDPTAFSKTDFPRTFTFAPSGSFRVEQTPNSVADKDSNPLQRTGTFEVNPLQSAVSFADDKVFTIQSSKVRE